MGNIHKYQVNNSSMTSKKNQSFFSGFGCNILRIKKKKLEDPFKSKSLNFEDNEEVKYLSSFTIPQSDLGHSDKKLINKGNNNEDKIEQLINDKCNKVVNNSNGKDLAIPELDTENSNNVQQSVSIENSDKTKFNVLSKSINHKSQVKENCDSVNCDYSESYKSYLCRKNRYISSPRTCFDNFKFSNYSLKLDVIEKDRKIQSSQKDLQVYATNHMECDIGSANISNDRLICKYPRLSENSLNSDDLMLTTEVNLDQADDDVSKDYNTTEKEDAFILDFSESLKIGQKSINETSLEKSTKLSTGLENSCELNGDESEKNDIVSFDDSQDTSTSVTRKSFVPKGFSLRPHSFSSPLRPHLRDSKFQAKRCSNLSTVDSFDVTWTWISASEAANLSQEVSNLKLMLLKMRRLLLDETNNEMARNDSSVMNTVASNVFSEPSTPVFHNMSLSNFLPQSDLNLENKQWENMSKEMLIQELHDLKQQNGNLQFQLKEKCRIINLLQDQQQHYRNHSRRLHSMSSKSEKGTHKIIRSSTFETASTLNNQTFCLNADLT